MANTSLRLSFASALIMAAGLISAYARDAPLSMLRTAYENIAKGDWAGRADPADVSLAPRKLTESWFTRRFIVALKKNADCYAKGKEGSVISVWYEGQDNQITELKIEKIEEGSTRKETIRAAFLNFGRAEQHDFLFRSAGRHWRIDDVLMGGQSLYQLMMKGCAA